ncbi:MAG: hypothetical protein LUP99_06220 [Methanomicrobiales archaeon]|nr:hypothetical protein [Methanomicrobiales archaeon]
MKKPVMGLILIILFLSVLSVGCSSSQININNQNRAAKFQIILSDPLYDAYDGRLSVIYNITNIGQIQPDHICIKINLVNNYTRQIKNYYYIYIEGLKPGKSFAEYVYFSNEQASPNYYIASWEPCPVGQMLYPSNRITIYE